MGCGLSGFLRLTGLGRPASEHIFPGHAGGNAGRFPGDTAGSRDWGGTPPAEFLAQGIALEQGGDFDTRMQAYSDLLDLWDDLVPAILLYRPVEAYGVRKNLDWTPYTFFYMDFREGNVKDNM